MTLEGEDVPVDQPAILSKEEKISESLKQYHSQPAVRLRAQKFYELYTYLHKDLDFSVENMAAQSGISVPSIYKYKDPNDDVSPQEEKLEATREWLNLPSGIFYRFMGSEDMTPAELLVYQGLEDELPEDLTWDFEKALEFYEEA